MTNLTVDTLPSAKIVMESKAIFQTNSPHVLFLEEEQDDVVQESRVHQQEDNHLTAVQRRLSTSSSESLIPRPSRDIIEEYIHEQQWDMVERLHEHYPAMAREPMPFVVQGENTTCLPLHRYLADTECPPPVSLIDKLVTAHPAALLETDSLLGRLPLHMALLRGSCSHATIRYIVEAMPSALQHADEDGNLPLHYAAMLAPASTLKLILESYPEACKELNEHKRYPLHLLCARFWNKDTVLPGVLEKFIMYNPQALEHQDRSGRLPLHVACSNAPRYDLLNVLVSAYPRGLLEQDGQDNSPLKMVKKFSMRRQKGASETDNDVVVAFIQEKTQKERRKKIVQIMSKVGSSFLPRRSDRRLKQKFEAQSLRYCYG